MLAVLSDDEIEIRDSYMHRESIKEIEGRRYDAESKSWFVPLNGKNIALLVTLGASLDDELRAVMQKSIAEKAEEPVEPIVPMPIKIKPYNHQIRGFNLCMQNDGFGLLYDVGLGKSLTAVAAAGARFQHGEVKKLLVICPLTVMPVWEREFKNVTVNHSVRILDGTMSERIDKLQFYPESSLAVAVINFEGARIMSEQLIKWQADMLIVDESQRIKNPMSKQSKAVHKIAHLAKYRIILTATPIGNSVADVYSQWKVIDEDMFGSSFYGFRAKYLILGGFQQRQIVGYKNMSELLTKAHSKALRVTKEEVLDLPPQVFETRYCELEPRARAVYDGIKRDCYSELVGGEISARNILTKLLRLQQCADGFLKPDGGEYYQKVSTVKMDLLTETLSDILDAGEKVVVFARFTAEIREIERELDKREVSFLTLDGSVKDKGSVVSDFQNNKDIKVLVCQTQVGGVGITLTAASIIIFYSLTFSLIDYLQAVGRIHRINQKSRCLYINLIVKGTVDEHIQDAISQKRSLSDNVVDNWKTLLGGT